MIPKTHEDQHRRGRLNRGVDIGLRVTASLDDSQDSRIAGHG